MLLRIAIVIGAACVYTWTYRILRVAWDGTLARRKYPSRADYLVSVAAAAKPGNYRKLAEKRNDMDKGMEVTLACAAMALGIWIALTLGVIGMGAIIRWVIVG